MSVIGEGGLGMDGGGGGRPAEVFGPKVSRDPGGEEIRPGPVWTPLSNCVSSSALYQKLAVVPQTSGALSGNTESECPTANALCPCPSLRGAAARRREMRA